LALKDFLVHLRAMNMHPGRCFHTELDLFTVQLKDMYGDVIADGDDFAYSAA